MSLSPRSTVYNGSRLASRTKKRPFCGAGFGPAAGVGQERRCRGVCEGTKRKEPYRRTAPIQDVVEPEPEHPQPDVVLGQVDQLAAGADLGQQEVTVGRPLL